MSSEPEIPFWLRWHALCVGSMRENKPPRFVCTGASECMGAHLHPCHSGARNFPELRVYSQDPLALDNLEFRFGRFGMRYI